ncbi:NAD-dependent epimerase/dehydratase family protein [Rhodoferax sp.]|uniref:NAD-dependent epimerase/dehydratase family protein n=1 Tax=Rhodoferax sp. TaxID=50421 RepID=UPI002633D314|nr:NAD-dependent epimerase/dehydratase family protein [Rhodoferax sp.]MDD2920294.1 NAD-dependent epimerase/dehydratase family protein [Rhodoferax sp.]
MSHDGVLLLGGAGFIGRALATRLQQEKVPVHIVGRHDVDQLEQLLSQCSTVVHLASATTPGSSARQASLELGNLALTLHLLDLLRAQPQTHLIFFSSGGTVYGNPQCLPVSEDSPMAPLSNHGAGKAAQESFCLALRAQGHAVTIVRPSNAFGPGQSMKNGFGLVRTLLEHARLGTAMEIWGDGENVRDYIYIDDVVEASLRLIRLPEDGGTYNLGSGMGYSVNQVKAVVEQVCGRTLHATYRPARGTDVRGVVLDNTRLSARLGWQPGVGLADGVARTWEWLQRA